MSAHAMDTAAVAAATDTGAPAEVSAQPISALDRAATVIVQRIADTAERHGWRPQASRLSDFIEAQLAELDRYRVAAVERDARERENAVTAQQHPVHRG